MPRAGRFAASDVGFDYCPGQTLAFARHAFGPDLMHRLASEPAEDAAATKHRSWNAGRLHVFAPAFMHPSAEGPWRLFGRGTCAGRACAAPHSRLFFALEAGCGVFPAALFAFLMSSTLSSAPSSRARGSGRSCFGTVRNLFSRGDLVGVQTGCSSQLCRPRCVLAGFIFAAWTSARFEWRGRVIDGAVKRPMLSQ